MRKLKSAVFILVLITLFSGCKKDSNDNPTGPTIGGSTRSVSFIIGQRQGNQGGIMFTAKPSAAVTVTQVTISLPAQSFQDIVQGDWQTVFQSGQVYDLD